MDIKPTYSVFRTEKQIYDRGYGYIDPVTGDDGAGTITTKCFELVGKRFKTLKGAIEWRNKHQQFEGQYVVLPVF